MQEAHSIKHPNDFDDEIDLRELFYVLLEGKWIIVSLTAFVSIVGVIYSLSLPNIYESKAMLVPVNSSSGIAGALGSYGGLAGLAGISLPSGGDEGNSAKAIQKISSLSFFENNILTNIHLPDLMAVKSWNSKTNTLTFDDSIYDTNSNTWIRDFSYPQQQIPSAQESFEVFKIEHLSLSEDKKSGFITLSIKHQSPFIAKQWAELIVNEVNAFYRQKDKSESEKAVNYLNQQISITGLSEIKQVIAQLLQEETKKLTLVEANQYYVFDYIDPPAVMEEKSEPKRALIFILSALLGGMLSIILVLIRHYAIKQKIA
ncbi:Wzz/FepE/Etk N-terminal domain-containing protein [Gammaproteobacteria bacterium]|nr:Wzz/FepE/Etk N-terminal domain-containing protein [Gammaproteobacteria bacterium]MDA8957332.1 Wzz/FepE/Etk N-terminal domain-containing protein [Gammaproteobacteria bacterium]MDA9039436.1 Wzz/FepE/Etk N-terminal domain-containing protein [Gammaproteobacteria bacterium]